MTKVFIISPNFVREMTNISDNLQDKFLQSAIRESQDMELKPIYGAKIYKKVLEMIADGSISDASNKKYKDLVDESRYFLAYSVLSKLIPIISLKLDNIGTYTTNDENAYHIAVNDIQKVVDLYTNKADFYRRALQKYIKENIKDFEGEIDCHSSNLSSAASTSIWLGGKRGKRTSLIH